MHVLEMRRTGIILQFLKMLPEYAKECDGEGGMHDTMMLIGALGWDQYNPKAKIITEYFSSSGTGQKNVIYPLNSQQKLKIQP